MTRRPRQHRGSGPRRHRGSGPLALLVALAILASLGLAPAAARAQDETEDTGGNNVQGNTYTSPDFGYAISWDATWDATDDTVTEETPVFNGLVLVNGTSEVYLNGTAIAEVPGDCVSNRLALFQEDDLVTELETVEENLDEEVANGTYELAYEDGDDVLPYTIYLQCQAILDGEAVLEVIHIVLTEEYEDQVAERDDLLATLSLEGDLPDPDADQPDPDAEDEDGPADDEPADDEPADDEPADDGGQAPDDEEPADEGDAVDLNQTSVIRGDGEPPDNAADLIDLIDGAILDINSYWARQFPLLAGGEAYTPPTEWVTWTGDVDSGCGVADSFSQDGTPGVGPFYCPPDRVIYYDLNFANLQLTVVPNEFVIPVVMAHELGHHIQTLLGLEVCVETPCLDSDLLTSQEIEYMADCWAGSWAQDAELRGRLGSSDIDNNISQYAQILGGGFESADIGSHGRGAERVWWFLNGYLEGGARCLDTSAVTAGMAGEDPTTPEDSRDDPDEITPEAEDQTPTAGNTVGLNEIVELPAYDFEATQLNTRDEIDTEEPDEGQFVVVYFHVEIADDGDGPFDYGSWTLVDGEGTAYEVDETATNQLLSAAFDDGVEEDLAAGGGYNLAMVFDVPADVSGLTLVNEGAGLTIDLEG